LNAKIAAPFQESAISGNDQACREKRDIAGDNLLDRHGFFDAVAQGARLGFDNRAQLGHRIGRAVFLPEAKQPTRDNDGQNNGGVGRVAKKGRKDRCGDKNQDDGAFELSE